MERKENLCQPPEYPAEMFSEYIESAKARALRASEIEAILGDNYDLNRLRELVEADRDGRCVVLPSVKQKDKESLFDALSEAVSGWGDMSMGEKALADSILAALKGEQDG